MKGVYVGNIVDEKEAVNNPAVSVAGNVFQSSFVSALSNCCSLVILSSIPRKSYSFKKGDILFQEASDSDYSGCSLHQFGFVNIKLIKQLCIEHAIYKKLNKILREDKDINFIIVYNTFSYKIRAIKAAVKSVNRKVVIIPLIADVPTKEKKRSNVQKIEDYFQEKYISEFDNLIVLSKYTACELGKAKHYLVVEGGCNSIDLDNDSNKQNFRKDIMFAGTLNMYSGIELLVDAMKIVHKTIPDLGLHIYGDGPLRENVEKSIKDSEYIIYHGRVSHEEVLDKQRNSLLLCCPRIPDDYVTRYTFPSKIIEYMASGSLVICNNLKGIPSEYHRYLIIPEKPTAEEWAKCIADVVLNRNKAILKADDGRYFLAENKIWSLQGNRTFDFICGVIDE